MSHLIIHSIDNILVGSLDAPKSVGDVLRIVYREMKSGEKFSNGDRWSMLFTTVAETIAAPP